MKRDEFLSTLGISFASVCAAGCLAACGKDDSTTPGTGGNPPPPPPSGINFTVNLSSEITGIGESKISNGVIVVRIAAGNSPTSFTAMQATCTHEGFTLGYSAPQGKFVCPNHGSNFSNSGVVTLGPATTNLKAYNVAVTGNTLTVTSIT